MTERERVCRNCRLFVKADVCPLCNESRFSRSWKGVAIIKDPNCEIAKSLGIATKGKYCIWVK